MAENILGKEKVSSLLIKFATPSVIAMLVGAFYNIIDQIFIGNSVGFLGNAATNIAFPLTTLCLSISLLIGIGGAANFNINLGKGDKEKAKKYIGNSFFMMVFFGLIITFLIRAFLTPLLIFFGATSDVLGYAETYTQITSIGFTFFILSNAGTALIRANGDPKFSMLSILVGGIVNLILDPILIFVFDLGMAGGRLGHHYWTNLFSYYGPLLFKEKL